MLTECGYGGHSCIHVSADPSVPAAPLPHCHVCCAAAQLPCCQASFSERERELLRQLEAARRQHSTPQHTAGANRRAAAAADEQLESLRQQLSSQAESHRQELTALQTQLQW